MQSMTLTAEPTRVDDEKHIEDLRNNLLKHTISRQTDAFS
jgi:hypothetical protein